MAAPATELRKRQELADPAVAQTHAIAAEIAATEERALALPWEQRVVPRRGGALTVPQKFLTGRTPTEGVRLEPEIIEGRCRVRDPRPVHATEEENIRPQRASARSQSARTFAGTRTSIRTLNLAGKSTVSPRPAVSRKDANQSISSFHPTSQASRLKPIAREPAQGLRELFAGCFDTSGDVTVIPGGAISVGDGPSVDFWESIALPILGPFRLTRWFFGRLAGQNRASQPVSPTAPDWQPITAPIPNKGTVADSQFVWVETPYQADDQPQSPAIQPKVRKSVAPNPLTKTRQTEPTLTGPEPLRPKVERIPSEDEARPPSYYQIIPARQNPALGPAPVAGLLASGIPLWSSSIINLAHTKAAGSRQAPIAKTPQPLKIFR